MKGDTGFDVELLADRTIDMLSATASLVILKPTVLFDGEVVLEHDEFRV